MKRTMWGLALMAIAAFFIGVLLESQESQATQGRTGGGGKWRGLGFNPNNVGGPGDGQLDDLPDMAGADRVSDRLPDSTPDQNNDGVIDAENGPGDDNRNSKSTGNSGLGASDGIADYFGPGDGSSDATPDSEQWSPTNRPYDNSDGSNSPSGSRSSSRGSGDPDNPNSDHYRQTRGLPLDSLSLPGDLDPDRTVNDGVPDNLAGGVGDLPDRPGIDSTPDGSGLGTARAGDSVADYPSVAGTKGGGTGGPGPQGSSPDRGAFVDWSPDGLQDRGGNNRSLGRWNRTASSRSVTALFGPGDHVRDHAADEGGLATLAGGGGGGGGCSLVASRTATTGSSVAYVLALLAPVAVVIVRRRTRR